jgi:hypothetical protein
MLSCVLSGIVACGSPSAETEPAGSAAGAPAGSGGATASGPAAGSGGDTQSTSGTGAITGTTTSGSGGGSCAMGGSHPYFDSLVADPAVLWAYDLRSQAGLDGIETSGASEHRYPVICDPAADAMLQRIDPAPFVEPGGGSTSAEQKWATIDIHGTSMLLTWDARLGPGCAFTDAGDLDQHKAYRIDYGGGEFYLTWKTDYQRGANTGLGLAEMFMSSQTKQFLGPGTTNDSSEILEPRLTEFYVQADTWTRYWFFIEGNIGGGPGGELVHFSAWAADEDREPIHLYDRLPMYTPEQGLGIFRFEFNSSQSQALNDMMHIWNRNLVVLQGLSLEEVQDLLEKP